MKRFVLSIICAMCAIPAAWAEGEGAEPINESAGAGSIETYCYEGTLGQYGIHMRLQFNDYNNTVTGTYYYDHIRARGSYDELTIRGTYTGDITMGDLLLIEYNKDGKKIGQFKCEMSCGQSAYYELGIVTYMFSIYGSYYNYNSGKSYTVDMSYSETEKNGKVTVSPRQY